MTAPEPELEMNLLACDRATDDQISAEGGKVGHATNPVAAKVQQIKRGRYTRWLVCFEDCRGILNAGDDGSIALQRTAKANQQSLLVGAEV